MIDTGPGGKPMHVPALDLIDRVLDPGSFTRWDDDPLPEPRAVDPGYAAELRAARERTGLDEALVTGEGRIHGRRVAVVACEFGFLAGSIGVAAAERLVRAIERASAERLPLVASPTSGGTRMQEGTVAFLQMVKISAAVAAHKAAGLPYLVYLRHPTTGGVFASWGSLGHVTAAQPGALIGFLGPRVFEALNGEPFPAGVQVAENLYEHGLIDAVVPPERLRDVAVKVLDVLGDGLNGEPQPDGPAAPTAESGWASASAAAGGSPATAASGGRASGSPAVLDRGVPGGAGGAGGEDGGSAVGGTAAHVDAAASSAWDSVRRSRDPRRPGLRALLRYGARDVTPLRGTGEGESEPSLRLALARVGSPGGAGAPCVVLGHDRTRQSEYGPFGPAGLRQARRGMRLAAELGLPLVTVVDTAGAALSADAEQGGLAGEIARCLAELVMLPAPTVCLLLGEGAGGGALALLPADRVLCAEHGWLSPLPPEGASAILFRTTTRAAEIAERQGIRSADLTANGVVDRIIPELPDAAAEPEPFIHRVADALADELTALRGLDATTRIAGRLARYRTLGLPQA
ncbi:carboxyl transferase domain-containing protein [Yinghuangia seranimata]|uniref:carboxyl transferase domain-containing protein n=1 Tax=Yinghuangia seranimata TaxID=408067 RepID=UPI00248CA5A4|nr:carboxyl transferase domain-containing protein [Yinghuangia seranimata]MDI2126667.1 carboxyl transferase domain-containing protein [Yinghuangia seranimata]